VQRLYLPADLDPPTGVMRLPDFAEALAPVGEDALGRLVAPDRSRSGCGRSSSPGSTTDLTPLRRRGRPSHLTASAVVLDRPRTSVLLVLHARTGLWLQPGGHVEDADASLAAAALREAVEETGIADLRLLDPAPVHLERHAAPCGAEHHLDVRFALQAPGPAVPSASAESLDAAWFPLEQLPAQPGVELRRSSRPRSAPWRRPPAARAVRTGRRRPARRPVAADVQHQLALRAVLLDLQQQRGPEGEPRRSVSRSQSGVSSTTKRRLPGRQPVGRAVDRVLAHRLGVRPGRGDRQPGPEVLQDDRARRARPPWLTETARRRGAAARRPARRPAGQGRPLLPLALHDRQHDRPRASTARPSAAPTRARVGRVRVGPPRTVTTGRGRRPPVSHAGDGRCG
jgi:8-oxo-dGTP pyrophosphatase MutT (NUDIX family)